MSGELVELSIVAAANIGLGVALLTLAPEHPALRPWSRSRHRRAWGIGCIVVGVLLFAGALAGR